MAQIILNETYKNLNKPNQLLYEGYHEKFEHYISVSPQLLYLQHDDFFYACDSNAKDLWAVGGSVSFDKFINNYISFQTTIAAAYSSQNNNLTLVCENNADMNVTINLAYLSSLLKYHLISSKRFLLYPSAGLSVVSLYGYATAANPNHDYHSYVRKIVLSPSAGLGMQFNITDNLFLGVDVNSVLNTQLLSKNTPYAFSIRTIYLNLGLRF